MKKLAKFWARMLRCNCAIRINTIIVALVPALEQLQSVWPTFREHLPADMYGVGFIALGIANVLLHARKAAQDEKRDANPPVIGS